MMLNLRGRHYLSFWADKHPAGGRHWFLLPAIEVQWHFRLEGSN